MEAREKTKRYFYVIIIVVIYIFCIVYGITTGGIIKQLNY